MRCLAALAKWEELSDLCRESWVPNEVSRCLEMAPMVHNLTQLHIVASFLVRGIWIKKSLFGILELISLDL